MLVTVAIVVMVSSCVMLGVDLSRRTFSDSVMVSRAESLERTINQLVSDELRYADHIELDGKNGLASYTSITRGSNAEILQKDGKVYIRTVQSGEEVVANILGASAYPDGITVERFSVKYADAGFFDVSYELCNGDKLIKKVDLQVEPLSAIS